MQEQATHKIFAQVVINITQQLVFALTSQDKQCPAV